ncbi:MAG: hypothetical protein P4L79_12660 [Legionella sp.]|uniref:YopJ family acetyltransferase n=1 Tax=Legionella sp. TaxID=459 RepID=UPI0028513070|nr:hypothetical protein [Legionella sp.]
MRRSLSELICDDLAELANHESDYIASEEAIHFMKALYNKNKELNIHLIHKEQFSNFLKSNALLTTPGHYQFIIEVGERSKLKQRSPETIHYCAVDLFVRSGKPPLAFVGDHYRGHNGYYSEFEVIAKTLGVQFVVVGGATYQADSVHCPVFSLQHLLLTAEDDSILPLLEKKTNNSTAEVTYLNWADLSPMYMVYSQSVNTLFNYVRDVKLKEETDEELDSTLLANSQFAQHLHETLYSLPQKGDNQGKIRNKAIRYLAAHHAGIAVTKLESESMFDTEALINICYAERYPLVHELLFTALKVERDYPFETTIGINNSHPLFELAFYQAHIMEGLLKNTDFRTIFTDKNLLILMQKGLLNPIAVFNALTEQGHYLGVNKSACRNVASNLILLATLVKNGLDDKLDISSDRLIQLLTAGKTKNFFQNKALNALFEKGLISLELLQLISPNQVDVVFLAALKPDEDKLEHLRKQFIPTVQASNSDETDDDIGLFGFTGGLEDLVTNDTNALDDLFAVPEEPPVTIDSSLATKPQVHVGLLVQSMSKSIFAPSQQEDNYNEKVYHRVEQTL